MHEERIIFAVQWCTDFYVRRAGWRTLRGRLIPGEETYATTRNQGKRHAIGEACPRWPPSRRAE